MFQLIPFDTLLNREGIRVKTPRMCDRTLTQDYIGIKFQFD